MSRGAGAALLLLATLVAGCGGKDEQIPEEGNAVAMGAPPPKGNEPGLTPMAERVAVIGLLNKRNGIVRDLTLKPGQAIRVKDAIVRLRACETTAPWETEKLTGAFVQLDVQRPDQTWGRVFSGWLFKESPSLNVVEHPVYDVWTKSCAMSFPSAPGLPATPSTSSRRSSAPNAPSEPSAGATEPAAEPVPEPATTPEPSAPVNNAT